MNMLEKQERLFNKIVAIKNDLTPISALVQNDFNRLIEDEAIDVNDLVDGLNTFIDETNNFIDELCYIETEGKEIFKYYIKLLKEKK